MADSFTPVAGELPGQVAFMHTGSTVAIACALSLAGCLRPQQQAGEPRAVRPASVTERAALLDRLKALDGDWLGVNERGEWVVQSTYRLTAGGSVVREVLFPGTSREATNMYYMHGNELWLTHYSPAGNQPRLRARIGGTAGSLDFALEDVTDLNPGDACVGEMSLTFAGDGALVQRWQWFQDGRPAGTLTLELRRKK